MKEFLERLTAENWGILEGLLSQASSIDLPRLAISDREDARQFLASYGYRLSNPEEAAAIERIRREALSFIQRVFVSGLAPGYEPLNLPATIQEAGVTELLLLASCPPDEVLQRWACACSAPCSQKSAQVRTFRELAARARIPRPRAPSSRIAARHRPAPASLSSAPS